MITCLSFSFAARSKYLLVSASPFLAFPILASIGGLCSKKLSNLPSPHRKFAKHSEIRDIYSYALSKYTDYIKGDRF